MLISGASPVEKEGLQVRVLSNCGWDRRQLQTEKPGEWEIVFTSKLKSKRNEAVDRNVQVKESMFLKGKD